MTAAEEPLFRDVDLERSFKEVSEQGAAYIPGFLKQETLRELQRLCSEIEFNEVANTYEKVSERYFVPEYIPPETNRGITNLGTQLQRRFVLQASRFPALTDWEPNDTSVQLYDQNSYITSHRDQASYKGIIVVVSIQGEAKFEVRERRHGEPIAIWRTQPGDTVVLRARGFNPAVDGHPGIFHAVSGALTSTARVSIGFRQR